jgi:homeobox-leucine zipper protein
MQDQAKESLFFQFSYCILSYLGRFCLKIKELQLTLLCLMQNMMDGQHQLAVMQQQQHQNHGQQQQAVTSESDMRASHHDELLMMESKSGSDNMEGGAGSGSGGEELQEEDLSLQRPRKKRYHRHTQHQIQELEA